MKRRVTSIAILLLVSACAMAGRPALPDRQMAELWEEPANLERRNLLYGPGGSDRVPSATAPYEMLELDTKGFSRGYDVRDSRGAKWSVKLGPEAQVEVVVSRLLWAVGFHQPATYYLPKWTLTTKGQRTSQPPARFRLDPSETVGEWSWRSNPFVGTRPFGGLFVFMVLVNNWDLKSSQNEIYRVEGSGDDPSFQYVVKDLGASLGRSRWLIPGTRGDVEGFETEGFIDRVEGNRVVFEYQGAWSEPQVAGSATPADVRWICDLLARLSPQQWNDAFRAGGYSDAESARFIKRLREKVADGQNVG
jgi:hypothetical protein